MISATMGRVSKNDQGRESKVKTLAAAQALEFRQTSVGWLTQGDMALGLSRGKGRWRDRWKESSRWILGWAPVPPPAAGTLGQALVPLWVPESLMSGHAAGFSIASKFPNSSEKFYIDGLGIMAEMGGKGPGGGPGNVLDKGKWKQQQQEEPGSRMHLSTELQNL